MDFSHFFFVSTMDCFGMHVLYTHTQEYIWIKVLHTWSSFEISLVKRNYETLELMEVSFPRLISTGNVLNIILRDVKRIKRIKMPSRDKKSHNTKKPWIHSTHSIHFVYVFFYTNMWNVVDNRQIFLFCSMLQHPFACSFHIVNILDASLSILLMCTYSTHSFYIIRCFPLLSLSLVSFLCFSFNGYAEACYYA